MGGRALAPQLTTNLPSVLPLGRPALGPGSLVSSTMAGLL